MIEDDQVGQTVTDSGMCYNVARLKTQLLWFALLIFIIRSESRPVLSQMEDKAHRGWPQFLGPSRDGKSSLQTDPSAWQEGLSLIWRTKVGSGYASPTVSDGRLFIFDRQKHLARLICYQAETGQPIWEFNYPSDYEDLYGYDSGPRACPLVDQERVYVFGAEGVLHCLTVAEGKLIWSVDTVKQFGVVQNFFGTGSSPIVIDQLLIVQIGGSPPGVAQNILQVKGKLLGNGSGIVAFNKLTGQVVYQISDELASYASPVLTTIGSREWGFAFMRGGLVGFDPLQGKVNFRFPWRSTKFESVNAASPVIMTDNTLEAKLVFISESYQIGSTVLRVSGEGHSVVWQDSKERRDKSMLLHWNTPIHHDGYLYGCSGRHSQGAELRCVEAQTGKVTWSHPVDERMSLTAVGDHIIGLGEYGNLLLVRPNPTEFELQAYHSLSETVGLKYPAWAAPIVAYGFLYLRGRDRVYCFDLP